jgi:RNA polymerase sigma-70 factor, ECF subfamily
VADEVRQEIGELYEALFDEVFRYCAFRLFSKDLAEDATSAVFLRLAEEYPRFRGRERAWIRNWLYGAASNEAARCLRASKRRKRIRSDLTRERAEPRPGGPAGGEAMLDWPAVYEALSSLSEKDQAIVALRYFEDMESPAIARTLGMTRIGVRVRLSRAVKALRKKLGEANER